RSRRRAPFRRLVRQSVDRTSDVQSGERDAPRSPEFSDHSVALTGFAFTPVRALTRIGVATGWLAEGSAAFCTGVPVASPFADDIESSVSCFFFSIDFSNVFTSLPILALLMSMVKL